MILILHSVFKKIEAEGMFSNSFYETSMTLIPKPDTDVTEKEDHRPVSLMHVDAKTPNKIPANKSNSI